MRKLVALTSFALLVSCASVPSSSLHERALVIDTHADTPSEWLDEKFDLGVESPKHHLDFVKMKRGGLDAEFFVAYVPAERAGKDAASYCVKIIEAINEMVEQRPELAQLARSTDDIRRVTASGKRAILIGIEGGHAIEDSLELLRAYQRMGVRYMTLTHTNSNNWADSSGDVAKHHGLTDFGRDVVREMNRLGMLVDISHVSDETFYDVIKTSRAPVFASHSSARALADHPRNMTDDMLRALAQNGGVVMINFNPPFIGAEAARAALERERVLKPQLDELKKTLEPEAFAQKRRELRATMPIPPVDWKVIVDHIEHVVKIAGVDHVGLGSDFDGIESVPVGMENAALLPKITEELQRRGHSESDIRKILGENFMRVFAAVEAEAVKERSAK